MYKINSITRIKNDEGKKQYLVIKFVNKSLDLIKLKEIINSETSINAFPVNHNINVFREPCISLQYSNTIRADVVNYKKAIDDEKYHPATCNCSKYENRYIDSHHQHVFTGDLANARNTTLKNLAGKGLSFREPPPPPNKTNAYNSIVSALDTYIHKMSTALNKPASNFSEWKSRILKEAKKTVRYYPNVHIQQGTI